MKDIDNQKTKKYTTSKKVIFTSQASENIFWSRHICKYVIDHGFVPVNYFTIFQNFVYELADLSTMIDSVNSVILRCDELWVFGDISEGVWCEIRMCKDMNIPIRYFVIDELPDKVHEIQEIEVSYTSKFTKNMNEKDSVFCKIEMINQFPSLDLG